jgi:hypothetical protein
MYVSNDTSLTYIKHYLMLEQHDSGTFHNINVHVIYLCSSWPAFLLQPFGQLSGSLRYSDFLINFPRLLDMT